MTRRPRITLERLIMPPFLCITGGLGPLSAAGSEMVKREDNGGAWR